MTGQKRCCGDRERTKRWSRLGSCPKCMRLAAVGTAAAWVAYGIVHSIFTAPAGRVLMLLIAVAFSLLLAAHATAFFIRSARGQRAARSRADERQPDGSTQDRRGFLIGTALALGAVLVAPLAGLAESRAVAQESPPKKDPCAGTCTFTETVEYDAEDAGDGKVTISRFSLKSSDESNAKGCNSEVNFAPGGSLEFKVQGEAGCKIVTVEDFLNAEKNCGVKIKGLSFIEKKGKFDSIKLIGIHEVTCNPNDEDCKLEKKKGECQGPNNVQTLSFSFNFADGKVTHDGTVEKPKKEDKPGKGPKTVVVKWEKVLDCKATCK